MFETLNKVVLAGVGALSMTRERAEQIFDDLVQRGQTQQSQRQAFVKDLLDTASQGRRDMEDLIGRQISRALERLNVPTRDDFDRLEAKIDRLLAPDIRPPVSRTPTNL